MVTLYELIIIGLVIGSVAIISFAMDYIGLTDKTKKLIAKINPKPKEEIIEWYK